MNGGLLGLCHFRKNRVIEECNRKAEHLLLAIESIQLYRLAGVEWSNCQGRGIENVNYHFMEVRNNLYPLSG